MHECSWLDIAELPVTSPDRSVGVNVMPGRWCDLCPLTDDAEKRAPHHGVVCSRRHLRSSAHGPKLEQASCRQGDDGDSTANRAAYRGSIGFTACEI